VNNNIQDIIEEIFQKKQLEDVPIKELEVLVQQYPAFNFAHYLLSKKMFDGHYPEFKTQAKRTALYFTNPFWLQWLLTQDPNSTRPQGASDDNTDSREEPDLDADPVQTKRISAAIRKEGPSSGFEPYYTIDYFASQGIRVIQEENPSDKLGKQLKSFTEWLKTMKKLPSQMTVPENDFERSALIENFAAHSLEQKEVITETMAEVLVKQGRKDRATELYHKLSLLNPSKNAYFASKIEQLK
jgi:hypothetical protein